jgi:putative nucleotidyltransferase with HDIG domain
MLDMPKTRVLIAAGGDRRAAIARALGVHSARPKVEIGAATSRAELVKHLTASSWHVVLLESAFDGRDSSEVLEAASELLRATRVVVIEAADQPEAVASAVWSETEPSPSQASAPRDPGTGLPICGTIAELIDQDGRRPRRGILSCVAIHAAPTPETAAAVNKALGDGGAACRWNGVDIVAIRRAASAGEAFVWAEGLCSHLANASVGVTWFRAADLYESSINQADHALSLAVSRGPGSVCTWQGVVALERARRIALSIEDPLLRRRALLEELAGVLGPAQRDQLTIHSEEVAGVATSLAQLLRFSASECERVTLAGLCHDIGKIMIPDGLLAKPGPLSPLQRRVMDRHAAEGGYLCEALGLDPEVARIVRHHHTRFDSTETPPGAARIIAVADAMITMTSTRPYSPARSYSHALAELRRCRGTIFDPKAVVAAHILGASTMAAAA